MLYAQSLALLNLTFQGGSWGWGFTDFLEIFSAGSTESKFQLRQRCDHQADLEEGGVHVCVNLYDVSPYRLTRNRTAARHLLDSTVLVRGEQCVLVRHPSRHAHVMIPPCLSPLLFRGLRENCFG